MKRKTCLIILALIFSIQTFAQLGQVTLYDQCNYSGHKYYLSVGNYLAYQMKVKNDKLASIKIPNGMKVTLYEHDKYQGRSVTYTSNMNCLPSDWINAASSIVVESDYDNYNSNDYITFYNDCYSKGYSQTLHVGKYTGSQLGALKNNISSFSIYGNLRVKVYLNNENLSGYSVTYESSVGCLTGSQNDHIASLVIEYKPYQQQYPNPNYPGNNYAVVHTNCNYSGNSLSLVPGYYQGDKLGLLKYNISSIELPSNLRAKVFINNEYHNGNYYTLNESVSCLSATLNDRIGSIIIEEKYGGNNGGYEPPTNDRVTIFTDANYKGLSISLLPGTYSKMELINFENDALSSITVPPGYRVVLYEHENFSGKSFTVTVSRPNFSLTSWNDKASSIAVYREY